MLDINYFQKMFGVMLAYSLKIYIQTKLNKVCKWE